MREATKQKLTKAHEAILGGKSIAEASKDNGLSPSQYYGYKASGFFDGKTKIIVHAKKTRTKKRQAKVEKTASTEFVIITTASNLAATLRGLR